MSKPRLFTIIVLESFLTLLLFAGCITWWNGFSIDDNDVDDGQLVSDAVDTPERLVAEFSAAFRHQDIAAMESLFWWEGVEAFVRETVVASLADGMQYELLTATTIPLDSDDVFEYEANGKRYRPNLTVVSKLRVSYIVEGQSEPAWTSYLIGQREDKYFLTTAAPVAL